MKENLTTHLTNEAAPLPRRLTQRKRLGPGASVSPSVPGVWHYFPQRQSDGSARRLSP